MSATIKLESTTQAKALARERRTMAVLELVCRERERQEALLRAGKFRFNCASTLASDEDKLPIVVEEVGEVSKEIHEKGPHYRARLRTEIIQAAATLVAWAESLEPQNNNTEEV